MFLNILIKIPIQIILFLSALAGFFISCDSEDISETFVTEDFVGTCWTHSQEEDASGRELTYRPCDYDSFPISRYRAQYTFFEDNSCEYLVLHAADAHYLSIGRWEYDTESFELLVLDSMDNEVVKYELIELEEDRMILQHIE